jgi:hypothetical protein
LITGIHKLVNQFDFLFSFFACGAYGGEGKCIQSFGGEAIKKEAIERIMCRWGQT